MLNKKTLLFLIFLSLESMACDCDMPVFGAYETAILDNIEFAKVDALIDSGAMTSALDVKNIKMHVDRKGRRWVYYDFHHKTTAKKISMYQPVTRVVRVITHSGEPSSRPVVISKITIGKVKREAEVSLIDRSNFPQQLLVGRNYLKEIAVIDSGRKYLQSRE